MPYKNREDHLAWCKRYAKQKPWVGLLHHAKQRCNDKKHKSFKTHGALGIKCLISIEEVEYLCRHQGAFDMICPSLDRIKSDKDYTIDNCRIIEKHINERLPHDPVLAEKWTD